VENALGFGQKEQTEEKSAMGNSFYRKEGLDFLCFQRPGTQYGKFADLSSAGHQTRSQFYQTGSSFSESMSKQVKGERRVKPVELIYGNKMKPLLAAMWYDRAKKIN
jgi:hypothetical protein